MNVCARRVFLVASLCFFALLPCLSFAQNTIHVPADVPDIQTAIFAAQNGDTVLVSPGFYFGSITFQGRNITVMSSDGAAVTTVDSGSQPSAQFFNNENNGAVLKGFTFVNGTGIQASFASPTIEDNVITNNQGCQAGGISLLSSSAIVQRNTISNNRQFCAGTPAAGGISVDGQGSVQILNNTISGNQTAPGVQAGGIFTDAFGTTTISGNKIQNNVTDAAGGGIYANGSNVIIADNLITGNSASTGGGIQIVPGSNAIVVNNTVALNQAQQGAQLALDGMAGTVSLFNNVFYDLTGNGAIFCSMTGFTGFPLAQNNDAMSFVGGQRGHPAVAYTGSCSDPTGFDGNVQAEPQFTDPVNGDFHLLATSPLIDAGNSAAPDLPAQDLDGNPRIAAGSNLCLPFVDIGAYEVVFNSVGSANMGTSSLTFGEAFIGVPSFFTQFVSLIGTQGCTQITSITTNSDYQQTSNCSVLRSGDSCTIQVTFAPKIAGFRPGTLKVNLLTPPATLTAELSGTGLNSATITPTEVKFGIQGIQTTQFQSVSVSSTSGQQLVVSSVSITGDFQQFNNCTQFSSNVCFISVQFTPTVASPRTGMLTVVSNLGTFAVPLSGDGAAPAPNLSPTSLAFPSQTAGTASSTLPVTLTNNGTTDLFWSSVFSTPDFQVATPPSCNGFLQAGTSCTFNVAFTPTTLGPITGSMEIDTNGGPVTASLTGIGTAPIASLGPQILNFANQALNTSSAPQTITVTNISGAPLQLTSLSAPDNFLAASSCPAVLDTGASCGIDVTFGPISSGPYGGFLTLGTSLGPVTAALTVGSSRTFHVPSEVPSIAQAVQLAQDGDTVLVAPGTYFEQVSFQGKAITIASTGGAAVTTLDGQGFQTPVLAEQNEGPGSVLKGFTVTHGPFAGIAAIEASPTIEDNIITENTGCLGAGLQLQTSSAIIKGNTISNNMIKCSGDGAGIWIGQGSNVQVLNNIITGNQITGNGSGAGIAVSGSTATITSNTIQNNSNQSTSNSFGNGGGIALLGGTANITQNLITGNSAAFSGGGIWASLGTFPLGQLGSFPPDQLINNTIADNFAPSGSGLFLSGSGSGAAFANNLIIDSAGSTAIGCDSGLLNNNFSFNDAFSFPGGTAYGPGCGDPTSLAQNISQDPQFVNSATGNYRLQSSSPTIDAGTNFPGNTFPPQLPDRDLDGNGRILPGNPATCNGTIDLGAYEFASGANGTPGPLPASWDFGSWQVGNLGQSFVFNLTTQGCVAIASIKTTGDFQQTNTCNNAVSRFCSITVSFTPQHPGPRTGSLIVDYGTSAPPVTVALTGQGIDNPPLASPSSVNFAPQAVGTSSAAQQVSIFPTSVPLTVNAIWISGDFSQTNSCGATTVPLGGSCVINVVFTPTASGTGQGNLTVNTNAGVIVVPLNGQINPLVTLTPASLNFGSQLIGTNSVAQTATLTNNGNQAASIGSIAVTGDFAQTTDCGTSLAAGTSCTISVSFLPTGRGSRTGTLSVNGTFSGSPLTVYLSGAGQALLATASTTSLKFATPMNTTSATQAVTLTNSGDLPISISGVTISADYAQTNNCGTSLAVGASCSFSIGFTPTVRGFDNGSLVVNGNFGNPIVVALNGIGLGKGPSAVLAPPFLVFTNQAPNTVSPAQQLTYANTGDASISITSVFVRFGSFAQTNTCGSSLAPGDSCTINVTYNPLDTGTQQGQISIGSTLSVSADLAGSSVPQLHTPATLNFGRQPINTTSPVQTITFTNSTSNPINFFGAASVSPFNLLNHCFGTLAVGDSCTLDVTFAPTASGVFPGTIQLSGDFPGGQAIIPVVGTAPGAATFVPASLTFASQAVGFVSASQPVTITNNQDVSLNISGFQITGDFVQTNTCPTALIPGGSCTINISFLPSAVGARSGSLTITSDAGGVIAPLTLNGTGAVPAVGTITPQSLSFGTVPVNTQSTQQTVSLSNIGTAAMTVSVSISGNFTGDFIQTNNCGSSLPAGASCSINVVFTPTTGGTRTASLNVSGNSAPAVPSVNLIGIGGLPKATFSVTSLTFAPQLALTSSAAQSVTLSNTGGAPLSISGVSIFGIGTIDFTQTNNCGVSLAAGASCTINVVFTPSTRGARSATLSLSSNFSPAPNVSLSGTGQVIQLSLGGVVNLGSQLVNTTSAPLPIVATNNGDFPASITGIAISGDYAQTNNCGATLAVGAACTITITFTPTARGTRNGILSVSGNFTFSQFLGVTGTGQALQVSVSPTTVTFADQALNTTSPAQKVVLTNSGDLALSVSGVTVSGDFNQTNNCGTSLAAGLSCTISVTFTPTALGQRSGSLSISTNSTTPLGPLNVFGKGIVLPPTFSPTSLTFALQTIGTTSAAQSVTLSNTTAVPIVINAITADGDFSQTNNCGTSLAVSTSCLVTVTFTPTARGRRTGTLSVTGQFVNLTFVTLAGTGQAFVASLTPTSFNFGNEPVNTTTNPQIFTYTNTGDLPLTISGIAVTPDFSQTNTCPAILAVGASCTINATFVPRAVGVQTTSLTVSADVNSSASLTGNGVMPIASLSPASLAFGHQRVGTASAPQLVTVTNTGAFAFFINQVSFPGGYQITNNCSGLVNPGASCTVSVVFAPTNTQSGVGSLTIGGDFTATPPSVSLSGTADTSTGTLSPIALTFANQVVGSTSASQTVTLSSTGNVPINLNGIQTTGDFSQTNNCGTSVAAGTNCIITVTFTPTAHGTRSGSLSVSGDFTGAAPSATLSGNGTTPTAAWSPASLTFSNQLVGASSSAQPVTLTNSGDGPLTISGITVTGDFGQTNTCGGTLAPNSSCFINITFTPAATGSRAGSLSLSSNSSVAVSPVTLAGTGVAPSAVLSPASLSFTNQAVSTSSVAQAVTLSNPGSATLVINSIGVTGDFSQTNNCGASLVAGSSCTINVSFTPIARGSRSGTLSVSSSASGPTPTTTLVGTGIAPVASLSVSALTFAAQLVNTTSVAQSTTLTNTGDATLNLSGILASANFSQSNNCGASLAPGAGCIISMTFTPTATGARSGALTITDDPVAGGQQTVTLNGTGVAPVATLSPASLSFANQAVNTTSATQTATLTNSGTAALAISSINMTGDFAQANNCGTSLPAGANCTISVTFTPTGTGSRVGSLTLTDNSLGGSTQTASLSGTGIDFSLSASPSSVSITAGKIASFTVSVSGSSFNSAVSLSCSGLPIDSSCSFSPATVTPGSTSVNSTLQLSTTPRHKTGTPAGTYNVTITGTSGSVQHSSTILLVVN